MQGRRDAPSRDLPVTRARRLIVASGLVERPSARPGHLPPSTSRTLRAFRVQWRPTDLPTSTSRQLRASGIQVARSGPAPAARSESARAPTAGMDELAENPPIGDAGGPHLRSDTPALRQRSCHACALFCRRISGGDAVFLSGLASSSKRPPPVADATGANHDGERAHRRDGFGGRTSAISKGLRVDHPPEPAIQPVPIDIGPAEAGGPGAV